MNKNKSIQSLAGRVVATISFLILIIANAFPRSLDSGLVAYYPFNGNTLDESGNGNNGTNYGATLTTDRFGRTNKAYTFNQDYIEVPNSPSLQSLTTSFTIAFWINISQWDQNSAGFFAKSNTSALGQYGSAATNSPYIQIDIGGQYVRITRYFALNTWYFICLRWDGQEVKLYLNESVYDSANVSGPILPDNNPFTIGKHSPGSAKYLRGKIDDIRIYNRALNAGELLRLYEENILNLKVIPQGFYNPPPANLSMKDSVRLYVRSTSPPYQIIDSSVEVMDSITFGADFNCFVPIGSYYIAVKHRNSIETWSSVPVYIENDVSYDFTTSYSQAYGNNLFYKSGKYCIFGGDVNSDGNVDLSDVVFVYNSAFIFSSGYVIGDLTGDRYVDVSDLLIAYNNSNDFVTVNSPFTYQPPCQLNCERMLNWSGYTWCVMGSNDTKCYPGPNYFSSQSDNVKVDSLGDLHIRITKRNNKFYCVALFTTQTVGYGLYKFYVSSHIENLDKNIVVGLFTWNDLNCVTNANSEVDIEFTRWGDAGNPDVIEYSVQPTNAGLETERFSSWPMKITDNKTLHLINWTSSSVSFSSYETHSYPPSQSNLISSWNFGNNNPAKSKLECNSNPIVIPAPQSNTHLDMNMWLDGGRYPSDNLEAEVVIHAVQFSPAVQPGYFGLMKYGIDQ